MSSLFKGFGLCNLCMAMHVLSPGITVYGYVYALSWHHCIWLCKCSLLASLYMTIHILSPGITVYGYACALSPGITVYGYVYALSWHHCIWLCCSLLTLSNPVLILWYCLKDTVLTRIIALSWHVDFSWCCSVRYFLLSPWCLRWHIVRFSRPSSLTLSLCRSCLFFPTQI